MVWYSHVFKNFPQFVVIHTVKGFSIVSEAEVGVFSGILLLFLWTNGCLSLLQGIFPTRGRTQVSHIAGGFFICWIMEKAREFQKKHLLLLYWLCQSLWLCRSQQTGKCQFSSNSKEKQTKECSDYHTITFISHTRKVMLKMLQARLQQYVNQELPNVQAGCIKGRRTRDQIANILGS